MATPGWTRSGVVAALVLLTTAPVVSPGARGEPYLAVRTGYPCSTCHVNHSGGGKRTSFGDTYAKTHLYMALVEPDGGPALVDGSLSSTVSIGGDLRVQNTSRLEFENDDGEVLGASTGSSVTTAQLYAEIDMIPGVLVLYADQSVAPAPQNRELFMMLQTRARTFYGKIGRMLLPFGLRLIDDDAFIRNRTGYTYSRHDLGLEVGAAAGPHTATVNLTDTQLSTRASLILKRLRLGGSFGRSTARGERRVVGGFAGASFGRFTLLGEVDLITERDIERVAALGEIDVLVARGLNARATYEIFDRNRDVPNARDGQERITIGVEPFVLRSLQLRLFYRINSFIPQNLEGNQDEILLEAHAFF